MTAYLHMALLTTALWYLGTRATITKLIWSRYPAPLARFMDCAACAGFWWGVVVHIFIVQVLDNSYKQWTYSTVYAPLTGLQSMIWTPLVAFLHDQAMYRLGSAVPEAKSDAPPNE